MTIIVNGKTVYITQSTNSYSTQQCQWCGKDIKPGKALFHSSLSGYPSIGGSATCSLSHVKQMFKNKL